MTRWNLRPHRRLTDWWARAGVLVSAGLLLLSLLTAVASGAVWVVDHRISDQLAPVKADLQAIKLKLGITTDSLTRRD